MSPFNSCEQRIDPVASLTTSGIEIFTLAWHGIDIRIAYERVSTGSADCPYSHLEVMTDPPRRPLPITETGYKSLFLPTGSIETEGGAITFVTRWLDHSAKSAQWKSQEHAFLQGSLF